MGTHRGDRRSPQPAAVPSPASPARSAGGRRKAVKEPSAGRLLRIPAIPTLVGALALAAAAGGALGVGQGGMGGNEPFLLAAGGANDFLTGTDAASFLPSESRSRAISRDSQRQALRESADEQLKAAAEQQSQQRSAALASLAASAQKRADQIAENLWVLPTIGYHLTARFGEYSGLWSSYHTGLDFAAPSGTPIFAVADGVITDAGYDGAYGYKTVETLSDGTEIWYCHQSDIGVSVGQKVLQSQQIGRIGSTGNTTGPHLHIEVRPGGGDPVDPFPAFVYHGVTP